MVQKTKKLNFMINHELVMELEELVPPGRRSKVVNEAIMKELMSLKRQKLTEKLLAVKQKSPALSTEEIVAALKEDRRRR
ncbi:MAG: hypothetical protein FJ115_03400 [Deltaproteobacteria bacterium]|nr:hypothetical protein [Deltaproteobacteria bacterium]MBM4322583.1 hypothetical protein [Deltaproteobacteria bacterium]MBM4347250.1 hypothetical protein [Deltaproteobacteria bacterium]